MCQTIIGFREMSLRLNCSLSDIIAGRVQVDGAEYRLHPGDVRGRGVPFIIAAAYCAEPLALAVSIALEKRLDVVTGLTRRKFIDLIAPGFETLFLAGHLHRHCRTFASPYLCQGGLPELRCIFGELGG